MISSQHPDSSSATAAANIFARAILDTLRDPVLVLDKDLRVVVANRSFYLTFDTAPSSVQGRKIDEIDGGVWAAANLRSGLERVVRQPDVQECFEVEIDLPRVGRRSMLVNARKLVCDVEAVLLGLEDVTDRLRTEQGMRKLLEHRETLLAEMNHRVANSLQIIASILLVKALSVQSEETREHLKDACQRVLSVASVQKHLHATGNDEGVDVRIYLSKLCEALSTSMIDDQRPISIEVVAADKSVASKDAVSIGLVVTESVINALKHAYPDQDRPGKIVVEYEVNGQDWRLSVSDDGVGMRDSRPGAKRGGLGTTLINALSKQLQAQVEIESCGKGTTVSMMKATFDSEPAAEEMPEAPRDLQ